jgi:Fe-Mn family superoxide dismutase
MSTIIEPGKHKLPELTYSYDALEPHLDARTLELHHGKHHLGYVSGLNAAETELVEARTAGNFNNIQALERAIAFHGSGHINHTLYWQNMAPKGTAKTSPTGKLADIITREFGSLDKLKAQFNKASATVEGNGWGVLAYNPDFGRLYTLGVMNHQNLNLIGSIPLLVCDVWEHAYYLTYQNRRPDYITEWWNVADWTAAEKRFEKALKITG